MPASFHCSLYVYGKIIFFTTIWIVAVVLCGCQRTGAPQLKDTSDDTGTLTDTSTVVTETTDFETESLSSSDDTESETGDSESDTFWDTASDTTLLDTKMALTDVFVSSNCMPGVTGDKLISFWTVLISDGNNESAVFESATITVETDTASIEQDLNVDVTEIPLSNGDGTAEQRKIEGNPVPGDVLLCVTLCHNATYTLKVAFRVGNQIVTNEISGDFLCTS